jgi:hypothetical protein
MGEIKYTQRGFQKIEFLDLYDNWCSLQQSSFAKYDTPGTSAVWLGQSTQRMHLDRDQVQNLVKYLQNWLDNGFFGG